MKNLRKLIGIISITAIIACAMIACPGPWPIPDNNQTPVADDFDVGGNLTQTAGSVTGVTITAKSGKSKGAITIKYSGSTTIPQTAGSHAITFDVAAATGWNAAAGLSAGTLTVAPATPVAGDYDIGNLLQSWNNVSAVTITPKSGKSTGQRTIYYEGTSGTTYTKSTTLPNPSTKGTYTYAVTFDVAVVTGNWNAAAGLSAGNLVINENQTPVAGDYDIGIGKLDQTAGSVTAVTITPKSGKSTGAVTTKYAGSTTIPQTAGTYAVTFDVAAAIGWNPATGLSAGNLIVNPEQAQTLSAEIVGTPAVGKVLTASVQKNYAGTLAYEWYVGGQKTDEIYYLFYPMPSHSGKQITVKVTCTDASGNKKSATSPAVTMPASFQWTPLLAQYGERLYAFAKVGDDWQFNADEEGFSVEWYRGTDKFSNPNGYWWLINPAVDGGKEITVKITGYGATKDAKVSIPAVVVPVIPEPTIEWHNISTLVPTTNLKEIASYIEMAYDENTNDCHTAIDSKRGAGGWCIDFYTNEDDEDAQIVDGKLHIHFSTNWYYSLFETPIGPLVRQSHIGAKLAFLATGATLISEYSGNYQDIHMANATVSVTDFS